MAMSMNNKWQAQEDASTLARYQEILNDKSRMRKAMAEAKKQADALDKRASAMKKVATYKYGGRKRK